MFPNLACVPREINCQGLRKGALGFLACLRAPRSQSPLGSVCPWAIRTTDVPSAKHSTAGEQPLSSFFCVTTGSVMHVHTHIVHTYTLALNTAYLIFLLKVLCQWAPWNFCAASAWPMHLPCFMCVFALRTHIPPCSFRCGDKRMLSVSPSFPSFLLFKTSNSIFLTFASSQVPSVGRTYPSVSEPPSVGVVCTHVLLLQLL